MGVSGVRVGGAAAAVLDVPDLRDPVRVVAAPRDQELRVLLGWATLSASRGKTLVWPDKLRPALRDGKLSLEELRGWPVVINFWASWCIPCREEAPLLTASSRAHRGNVVFLGIDLQDLRGDALAFLREFDTPYVSVYDRGDKTNRAYGTTGVPETYYLDAQGRIVAHSPGQISRRTLEQGIAAIARTA